MPRALLIVNPAAARTQDNVLRGVEQVFQRAGWDLDVHATCGPGDARRLAEYGVTSGAEIVVVFGGDGTTMQAAGALVGTDVALGIVPGGTGNQLAGNLGIPLNPLKAAAVIVGGTARRLDLGRVERGDGVHHFAVACGTGLDARVMAETPAAEKQKRGTMAYVTTTFRLLPDITPLPFRIAVDGVEHAADAAVVLIANCGWLISPIFKLGAGTNPYDGLLDVIVLHARSIPGGFRALWHAMRERQGIYGKDVFAAHYRGAQITVTAVAGDQPVQLDGELWGGTPLTAAVVPAAIQVIHPEG